MDHLVLYILGFLILIAINFIVSRMFKRIAVYKGHDDSSIFAMCFFLGIAGYLYVLALPDLYADDRQKEIIKLLKNLNSKKEENNE